MSGLSDFEWQVLRSLNDGTLATSDFGPALKEAFDALRRKLFVTLDVATRDGGGEMVTTVATYTITEAGWQALALRESLRH